MIAFGNRVFDLQARVHLDEVELAVLVEEFDRAGAAILQLLHRVGADLTDLHALFDVQGRGVGFFPYLLMAALQRAVAFTEMDRIAFAVPDDLYFDMARLAEKLLHVDRVVAECGRGFGTCRRNRIFEFLLGAGDLHAAATATRRRLDQHGESDLAGDLQGILRPHFAIGARNDRNAEFFRRLLGGDLVAHEADVLGSRSDESDAVRIEDIGELGVLREEAVTRMHRIRTGDLTGGNDLMDVQIALARRRRADADALVGEPDMHGVAVRR